MDANGVLTLGAGVTPTRKFSGQRLDSDRSPNELHIEPTFPS